MKSATIYDLGRDSKKLMFLWNKYMLIKNKNENESESYNLFPEMVIYIYERIKIIYMYLGESFTFIITLKKV